MREKIALRFGSNVAEEIFSEFEMSEDEKVRKWLYGYFRSLFATWIHPDITCEEILAWLEKQGETFTKKDVDNAYIEGMAFAKDELEKQKPDWSEEDERMCQNILECLRNGWRKLPTDILKYESWFKFIKQRHTWKPSDKQMEALERCVDYLNESDNEDAGVIDSLCHCLKLL